MGDSNTIIATTIGNPSGGQFDNPWPPGHPSKGERVAIFAFEVTSVDEEAKNIHTYHVAPVDLATEGPVTPEYSEPQGITVLWTGCGAGTVLRSATPHYDEWPQCEVRPDDMRFILM